MSERMVRSSKKKNEKTPRRALRSRRPRNAHRGVATLWVILWMPAVLCLLGMVVEVGNLWLARVELTNAVEAAALAAVDNWGDSGNSAATRTTARARGLEVFEANSVTGQSLTGILLANGSGSGANDNLVCNGSVVILGSADLTSLDFNAGVDPTTVNQDYAVRVQATMTINSVIGSFCGVTVGPFNATAAATSRYDADFAKLYTPSFVTCPGP